MNIYDIMNYKIFILILILSIMSVSVVSAETYDNQSIGTNDESIDINKDIILVNTLGEINDERTEYIPSEHENLESNTILSSENSQDIGNAKNNELTTSQSNGTFKDLENIIWKSSDGDKIILDRDYYYDGGNRKVMSINNQITIDGIGHTLDGKNDARIFYISSTAKKITLINIKFINGAING